MYVATDMSGYLELADGSRFKGRPFGHLDSVAGECVFNTGMTGYPETMTDPSYRGQIVALTYPLVGNYGVPRMVTEEGLTLHGESDRIQVEGLIVGKASHHYHHWQGATTLDGWLKDHRVPALEGIDTRALTKHLRTHGTMPGRIVVGETTSDLPRCDDPNDRNLVAEVSITEPIIYQRSGNKRVGLIDCGCKSSIIHALLDRDITVVRLPWDHDPLTEELDGLVLSNGPGDPQRCEQTIANVRNWIKGEHPTFGICLGNQILALAAGAQTYKLRYGHRSQNQPAVDARDKRCYITSQNHGYAVDATSLPDEWSVAFFNANDQSVEGIRHTRAPLFSVQFHPEAVPGPCDTAFLFDEFVETL